MATSNQKRASNEGQQKSGSNESGTKKAAQRSSTSRTPQADGRKNSRRQRSLQKRPEVPSWLGAVISVVGVGVAVGAGLYATRKQWLPKADEWREQFSAAFADDETDYENFDQTRHAGKSAMRDHPGDEWGDIDDMSDASFPASDPPSFNPGTAG